MIPPATADKLKKNERLAREDIERLFIDADLCELGVFAHEARLKKTDPRLVTYINDRNINYTDICESGCRFCAFFKSPDATEGYVITRDELGRKIREAEELGAVQILLQGGLHPDLRLDFYTNMLGFIRDEFGIHVHGFSPPEIVHIAKKENLSLRETISALREAGLHSIPGGGAEILAEGARRRVSPHKCTAAQWIEVMREAHLLGMRTTATMMFGHGEETAERVEHLLSLRRLQDETGGFTAFIPWSFQPGNTDLEHLPPAGGYTYLKVLAISRLALDNFDNLQVSWVTQGAKTAQAALFFGANDFGSTMIEENVVAAAGTAFRMSADEIERLIRSAGFEPAQRNQAYERMG